MATYHWIIISRAVAGKENEFHEWYDNQHLKDVANVPGIKSAQRFKVLTDSAATAAHGGAPYDSIAIYELETDDPVGIAKKLRELAGTDAMPMSAALHRADLQTYAVVEAGSAGKSK